MRFEIGTITSEQIVQYYQTSSRIDRAIQIVDHVVRDAPGICIVQSQTKPKVRYVTDTWNKSCTCPDWTFRSVGNPNFKCKHLLAAEIRERINQ